MICCAAIPRAVGPNVKASAVERMRKLLMTSSYSRTQDDYEFMDRFVLYIQFFFDLDHADRLQYLKVSRGVSLVKHQILFNIGDPADSFYCVISGSLNVVIDLTRVHINTKREMNDILNRAKIYSCLHNPGVGVDESPYCTSYVVRNLKRFDAFGDVGMLTEDGVRTASVMAVEDTFLLRIEREAFLDCRVFHQSKEINQKLEFLARVRALQHWDRENKLKLCGRMERLLKSYNDVVIAQDDDAQYFYLVQLGECRLVKRYKPSTFVELGTVSSGQSVGSFEVLHGLAHAAFSVLVSSPTAILYRIDKLDFRHHILRDPVAEEMMVVNAKELYARMHPESVHRDLTINAQWNKCRDSIVAEATPRRLARAPYLRPFDHSLHPSPLESTPPPLSTALRPSASTTGETTTSSLTLHLPLPSSPQSSPTKPTSLRKPHKVKTRSSGTSPRQAKSLHPISADTASQKLHVGQQHWMEWASNGASNVSVERTGAASSSPLHQSPGPRPPSTPLESKGGSTTRHRTTQILLDKSARRVQLDDHTSIPETVSTAFKAITQTAT
ncbi:hypothetical protein, variant 1 [Aphanomyces astaci]|uniref:Cyclic nucleotide-binding domain-containing protein n=1 Tax=Aphanomyces astaci TaxID=112090 RepID=W4GHD5_APHAT|nr:hypothetical protein, variant 1 [Aphanomyces astaci]ETV79100.1 hypothetical protein, variant 1 [Aphanomyces astaci]|eukprot:XP_009831819.1 hypothetical protein, variant 1 [Aphanomyces astaci]